MLLHNIVVVCSPPILVCDHTDLTDSYAYIPSASMLAFEVCCVIGGNASREPEAEVVDTIKLYACAVDTRTHRPPQGIS